MKLGIKDLTNLVYSMLFRGEQKKGVWPLDGGKKLKLIIIIVVFLLSDIAPICFSFHLFSFCSNGKNGDVLCYFFFCTDKKEHTLNDETSDTFMSTCTNGMRVKCAHLTTKDIRIHNRHTERHKSFEFNVKLTDDIFDLLKTSVGVCLCSRCIQVFNVFALADFVFIFFR